MNRSLLFLLLLMPVLCIPVHAEAVINARVGQTIQISLESNPTTGYSWKISSMLPKGVVKLVGSKYISSQKNLTGAGGIEKWMFKAVKNGTAQIRFCYQRPWEKGVPPVETKSFDIKVNGEKTEK